MLVSPILWRVLDFIFWLEHVPKKLSDVFDPNMLQLFEFECFLIDRIILSDRKTL